MAKLKIRIYKCGKQDPDQTITVPLGILNIAMKFVPEKMQKNLEEKGLDINMISGIAKSGEVAGIITEIEDHVKNEKTVISIE